MTDPTADPGRTARATPTSTCSPVMDDSGVRRIARGIGHETEHLVTTLSAATGPTWGSTTRCEPWDVRDLVVHLIRGDWLATLAVRDPIAFADEARRLRACTSPYRDPRVDPLSARLARTRDLLDGFCEQRAEMLAAFRSHPLPRRAPWVTGEMSPQSLLTSRLMESWAHSSDIHQAVGTPHVAHPQTLFDVADFGIRARAFSFHRAGLEPPSQDAHVVLTTGLGETQTWGAPDSEESITGPVEDFCRVVTRRAAVGDTELEVAGEMSTQWMAIAQCFP